MTSLWFVLPAHGRVTLAEVCLRQLARTCETLTENGVHASAVVIADDDNLDVAADLGFATVERDNRFLGRRWNDGYELAARAGVDYVVACGSDDWIDPEFILSADLPDQHTIRCARLSTVVREDGRRAATLELTYDGGDGVRIIPTALLKPLNYRPADEDKRRAIDTSVMQRLSSAQGQKPRLVYHDLHPLQIVDFKSSEQLNPYADCLAHMVGDEIADPLDALANVYPVEAVDEMRAFHGMVAA